MTNEDANLRTLKAAELLELESHPCPKCGLLVPASLDSCPNDGTALREISADTAAFERYELLSPIGEGGMSVVFKAKHLLMGKTVAIKMLQSRLGTKAIKRFHQEAKAVSLLSHPNITAVHDFGILPNGSAFLVMDYEAGENLADYIKTHGTLQSDQCLPVFVALADALAHAHEHKVLHRDLKPSNVMISQASNGTLAVKLVDFGIAKVVDESSEAPTQVQLTGTGEVCGSPAYMSPEQCHGMPVDQRSDVYSLGCLMYEALSGKPPHAGDNPIEVLYKHMNVDAAPPAVTSTDKRLGLGLQQVLLKALRRDREERYQTAEELKADLQLLSTGAALRIAKPPAARRNLWLYAGIPLCLLVLATFLFNLSGSHPPTTQPNAPGTVPGQTAPTPPPPFPAPFAGENFSAKRLGRHALERFDDAKALARFNGSTQFVTVDLARTRITDKTLEALKGNAHLSRLSLDRTYVTDEGLRHLSAFSNLEALSLMNMPISYAGIKYVSDLQSLTNLHVNHTDFSDASVAEIAKLPRLQVFGACYTRLTDDGLVQLLEKVPTLQRIGVGTPYVSDKAFARIPRIATLTSLNLRGSKITDAGVKNIADKFPMLNELILTGNLVTLRGLSELTRLPHLKELTIAECPNVSPEDLVSLKKLLPAVEIRKDKQKDKEPDKAE